jgi:uncharacterized Zn finger protein
MRVKWDLTPHEIAQAITDSEYLGLCRECGSVTECVEPDARNYQCPACSAMEVFSLEELLMMGEIEIPCSDCGEVGPCAPTCHQVTDQEPSDPYRDRFGGIRRSE